VLLEDWLPDGVLAATAAENNLAETAFVIARPDLVPLRWFTPTVEVDLCGHATLAAAHVLFRYAFPSANRLTFGIRSGELIVTRDGELLSSKERGLVAALKPILDGITAAGFFLDEPLYHSILRQAGEEPSV
jgi:PhzF family phenazine biosynthesis protein